MKYLLFNLFPRMIRKVWDWVGSLVLRLVHGKDHGGRSPWNYFYSVLIYLSSVPGIFFFFIIFYLAIFQRVNLLQLSLFTYILPVVSMFITLIIIRKSVTFDEIPGFNKIIGLFAILLSTFLILLILDRLRIFIFFRGSILSFGLIWVGIFVTLKIAAGLLFGKAKRR